MQISLDLLELADYETPETITQEIFRQNPNISLPIDLEQIASKAGITDIRYHSFDGLEGALIANEEKSNGIIAISKNIIPSKQRFTLGHELGHFLLPRHGHRMECTVKDMTKKSSRNGEPISIEAEANQFASLLLMPPSLIRQRNLISKIPSMQNILDLKEVCNVSLQACANNYVNFHDGNLAVVYTCNNVIEYGWNSDSNPLWLEAHKKSFVPKASQINSLNLSNSNSIVRSRVSAAEWFSKRHLDRLPETVIEETYIQEKGYAATLLWIEET